MGFMDRLQHGWNAFMNRSPTVEKSEKGMIYGGYSYRPDKRRTYGIATDRNIVNAIITKIAIDCAIIDIRHCELDDRKRYLKDVDSGLNRCLSFSANIDQSGRAFRQDIFSTLLDVGHVALVPIELDDSKPGDIASTVSSMRVGKVVAWYPTSVKVSVFNERAGRHEEIILSKKMVSIVENPFYAVMNDNNGSMKRLSRKLSLLDISDENIASGKLDMVIQLPYVVKGDLRKRQAEERSKELEMQLTTSKYGIGYIDGTEKITQLNRPIENHLLEQIDTLKKEVFNQMGMSEAILDGSADEKTMLNYYSRIVEPIISSVIDECKRKWLSDTAIANNQSIMMFRDPFKLVPVNDIADIADKFTRNEIMTSNELRQAIGMMPSADPKADKLLNSNLNHSPEELDDVNNEEVDQNEEE